MREASYAAVLSRKNEVMKASLGIDYDTYASSPVAFDYERMMAETGYSSTTSPASRRRRRSGTRHFTS